jgi:CTP synthase (UTP-ammonia lyase)
MLARKATTIVVSELSYHAGPNTTSFLCERETQMTIREKLSLLCNDNEKDGTKSVEANMVAEVPGTEKQPLQKTILEYIRNKYGDVTQNISELAVNELICRSGPITTPFSCQ